MTLDLIWIVFLPKMPHPEYLAALAHSDLFLDTFPYGAHTTARDALFVGCPVLTITGETFAARVATSLNAAAGMAAFNTTDIEHYVANAIQLASAPEQLKLWRDKLIAARPKLMRTRAVGWHRMICDWIEFASFRGFDLA